MAMHPLLRLWAFCAAVVAVALALRGAFVPALACFLLSPAPAWVLAPESPDRPRASRAWLRGVAIAFAAVAALYVAVVALGGLPPVHEWRGAVAGR